MNQNGATQETGPRPAHEGDWGWLQMEPCRYCRFQGKVYFLIDEGPEGKSGMQIVRCDNCHRSWIVDSALA